MAGMYWELNMLTTVSIETMVSRPGSCIRSGTPSTLTLCRMQVLNARKIQLLMRDAKKASHSTYSHNSTAVSDSLELQLKLAGQNPIKCEIKKFCMTIKKAAKNAKTCLCLCSLKFLFS